MIPTRRAPPERGQRGAQKRRRGDARVCAAGRHSPVRARLGSTSRQPRAFLLFPSLLVSLLPLLSRCFLFSPFLTFYFLVFSFLSARLRETASRFSFLSFPFLSFPLFSPLLPFFVPFPPSASLFGSLLSSAFVFRLRDGETASRALSTAARGSSRPKPHDGDDDDDLARPTRHRAIWKRHAPHHHGGNGNGGGGGGTTTTKPKRSRLGGEEWCAARLTSKTSRSRQSAWLVWPPERRDAGSSSEFLRSGSETGS